MIEQKKELAIIGAGIAGVSAAIYAKRAGLDFYLFEANGVGGQLLLMENIDNYAGLGLGAKGAEMAATLSKTLSDLGIDIVAENVVSLNALSDGLNLSGLNNQYEADAVIVATGASFRKLGVKGEAEFSGKGVSYCAVCDGFFFKNKEVAVVGGGNTAVEEALYLSQIVKKVTLIHRRDSLRALEYLRQKAEKKDNIEIIYDSVIEEISGDQSLRQLSLRNVKDNKQTHFQTQGLFVAIGITPNTENFKSSLKLDEQGFILSDAQMMTSLPAVFACGDCRQRPLKQLITAAAEGAIAVLGAYKKIRGYYISV
jgi:thioredoxin reductase (NADPH)